MNPAKKIFSQRYFAQKAGFSSHSFCAYLIQGKRNLGERSIPKMLKGLRLKGKYAEYFTNLVHYNQATSKAERESFYKSILKLRKQSDFYKLSKKQVSYYEKWYYPVVKELVCFTKWDNDYKVLADMVYPPIKECEAKEAVDTLERIDVIRRDKNGKFYPVRAVICSENIPLNLKKNARRDVVFKGLEAADKLESTKRYFTYSTLTIDQDTYQDVIKKLDEIRKQIVLSANICTHPDGVYHLVFEIFPSSNIEDSYKEKYNGGENENI